MQRFSEYGLREFVIIFISNGKVWFLFLYDNVCAGTRLNLISRNLMNIVLLQTKFHHKSRCSHSDLASILAAFKAASRLITQPIDEMIVENNRLPSLPGQAFGSLKILRLMLRNNNLERVATNWLSGRSSYQLTIPWAPSHKTICTWYFDELMQS